MSTSISSGSSGVGKVTSLASLLFISMIPNQTSLFLILVKKSYALPIYITRMTTAASLLLMGQTSI